MLHERHVNLRNNYSPNRDECDAHAATRYLVLGPSNEVDVFHRQYKALENIKELIHDSLKVHYIREPPSNEIFLQRRVFTKVGI